MKQACIQAVQAAAGRVLKPSELEGIDTMIRAELRKMASMDRNAFMAMSNDARLAEAGKRAGQRLIHEAAKNRQRVVNRINLHAFIERNGGNTLDGLRRMIESDADSRSTVQSLESKIQATEALFLSNLLDVWQATNPRIFGLFSDRAGEVALLREIMGEDSGSPVAKAAAKTWREQAELMRQQFNAVGGDIPLREDWGTPQHHSQSRVHKATQKTWTEDTLPLMKREAFVHEDGSQFTDAELTDFLGHAWTTIASGGLNKADAQLIVTGYREGGKTSGQFTPVAGRLGVEGDFTGTARSAAFQGTRAGRGTANVANRGNVARQLHFKDADAYMAYQAKYGERDLYSILVGHVRGSARDIASVQSFGDNPSAMVAHFLKRGQDESFARGVPAKRGQEQATRIQSLFDHISGRREAPANEALARGADATRQWLSASRLGSAVISSFSDEATMAVTANVNNVSYMQAFRNELSFLASGENRDMARRAGLAMDSIISSLNRFGQDGMSNGFASRLANTVMTVQGLNLLTDARKAGFGVTMYSAIGKINASAGKLADLDPVDNRILLSKGVSERDWSIWKLAQREDWGNGNNTMLTPDAIMRISDADMDGALKIEAGQNQADLQKLLDDLAAKDTQELGWLANRQQGLDEARDAAFQRLDEYAARRDAGVDQLRQRADDLRELMAAKLDEAQIEFEVSKYAAAEAAQGRVVDIVQDVETGALESDTAASREAWRASLAAARGGAASGRELGRLQAQAKARVAAFDARVGRAEASASKEINAKAEAIGRQMSKRIAELDEYTSRLRARQVQRAEVAGRMRVAFGQDYARLRQTARFEAAQKLLGAVLEEVDTAVITPRASERARMLQFFGDPQRGTLGGELARSVLLFKSFPLAMMRRHWRRAISQPGRMSKFKYAGALLGLTTIAGMASVQITQMLTGKDPRNMNPFEGRNGVKNWFAALLKGGSLGIYGDFLFSDQTKYGGGLLGTLQGPVFGAIDELFGLSFGNLNKARRGEDVHVGAGAVRTLQGLTPGASLWYAKSALNHLVFQNLQEELSPGYLRKMKARAEKEYGDSYWWEPGPALPQRAPDLGAAVGQ